MTKRKIIVFAKRQLAEGKTHQETFDELKNNSTAGMVEIAKVIRFIPTLKNRLKYRNAHLLLLFVLVSTVVIKIVMGLPFVLERGAAMIPIAFLFPLINLLLIYGVATFQSQYYRLVGFIALFGLLRSLFQIVQHFNFLFLADLSIGALLVFLGFYLHSKMVPKFFTIRENYTDEHGHSQKRNTIKFSEN